jgi:preprotein translocase subunit YajC
MFDQLSPNARVYAIFAVYLVIFVGIWWFVIVKPRRDAQRRHRDLVDNLKKGDRIVTAGGIHGRVLSVKDKTCVVEVAEGTRITFDRAAVSKREGEEEEGTAAGPESKEPKAPKPTKKGP